jgi:hypothetical protein
MGPPAPTAAADREYGANTRCSSLVKVVAGSTHHGYTNMCKLSLIKWKAFSIEGKVALTIAFCPWCSSESTLVLLFPSMDTTENYPYWYP